MYCSKSDSFDNTENINVDFQCLSPAEEKEQVSSGKQLAKWHCGTKYDFSAAS